MRITNAVKDYASDLIKRAENEDDLEMTLDEAVNQLVAFEKRTAWTDAIDKLLQKQAKELAPQKYAGGGALTACRKEEYEGDPSAPAQNHEPFVEKNKLLDVS